MARPVVELSQPPQRLGIGKISTWLFGIVSFGLLVLIVAQVSSQLVGSLPAHRLELEQDIPLPAVLPLKFLPDLRNQGPQNQGPLTPGVAVRFDHFDFQTLDPRTKLLFIAHTGPAPDKYEKDVPQSNFKADKDSQVDGNVIVFDTSLHKPVGRVDIPQIAGIVAAPDLGKVFAADANDNIVYSIDERTLKATAIQLDNNESPDAIEYDPDDHKVFVSDPGLAPANAPTIDPKNQNLSVINVLTNQVTKINLGHMPKLPAEHAELVKFGYDVGHNHYDPGLRRIFVTSQQLTDQSVTPLVLPPPGTGELISVDPVSQTIVGRVQLPNTCGTPHGMNIDTDLHIAFIACTDVDPANHLVQNLVRVDLRSMQVIHGAFQPLAVKPDIVVIDHSLHVLFVGCNGGISVFDIRNGNIRKLGDYNIGKGTHTVAVNEATQEIYLPLVDVGGRPVLRIAKYNPNGI